MQIKSGQIYKQLAFAAKIIGFFPVVILICGLLRVPMDYSNLLYYWFIAWVIGMLGYFQMSINNLLAKKLTRFNFIRQIIMGIGYIIEIALVIGFIAFILQGELYFKIISGIIYLFIYYVGISSYSKAYYNMLTMENICFITAFYILSFQICQLECLGLTYILIIGIYIFINNQKDIERLLIQTKANTPMAENIKKDNVRWVWLLISFVLIGYPFRKQISKAVGGILKSIFGIIGRIVLKVVEWINRFLASPPEENIEQEQIELLQTEAESQSSFTKELIFFIICIILMVIILKNRKAIIAGIRRMVQAIKALLRHLYKMLFGIRDKIDDENECYWELEETIDSSVVVAIKKGHIAKHKWLRSTQTYLRQLSPHSSFREGYKLLLQGAQLKGLTIEHSKTPREILADIEQQMVLYNMAQGTEIYENVRYGEQQIDIEELTVIAHILQELRTQVKG